MRFTLTAALILISLPAEARHHRYRYAYHAYAHCRPGEIWMRHDRECVRARARITRGAYRDQEPPARDPMPRAKRGDRLVPAQAAPTIDLPYVEPYPIMGKPRGHWWWL